MSIRLASVSDAPAILEIYKPYVLESPITFETELPPVAEFENRIRQTLEKFPWLVCERDGVIVGYAYANPFKVRSAYAWSVESTVYVRQGFQGHAIGKLLYDDLIQRLKIQGVANVIGGITLPNEASVRLHERMGFHQVARFKNVGFKCGRWWDVGYWQLELPRPEVPAPLSRYTE